MLKKWIDLKDRTSNAKLKFGTLGGAMYFWIVGLPESNPRFQQAIEKLGFTAGNNRKYLLRPYKEQDASPRASSFHAVWPDAAYGMFEDSQVYVNFLAPAVPSQAKAAEVDEEARAIRMEIEAAYRLGRNADGYEVYQSLGGRFIYREENGIVRESQALRPAMFLYAPDVDALDLCADGFVMSMLRGEVQREKDFARFMGAVNAGPNDPRITRFPMAMREAAHEAIDAAVIRFLRREHATPNDSYGDANRLYDYLPTYKGPSRGRGAMPLPLSVIAQRLLGDTAGKSVVLPNAFDGAAFSFLAPGTVIRAFKGKRDLSARAKGLEREGLTWLNEFHHARESNAEAMFFNADPVLGSDGLRTDYRDALLAVRSLAPGGRAALVLAADDDEQPGVLSVQGRNFIEKLFRNYDVEDAFDVGREMTKAVGTDAALRVISLRNQPPQPGGTAPQHLPVCHGWDEIKHRVDESLSRAAIREQESEGLDMGRLKVENVWQRPYLAFSKVGEATTMVPKELQAPLQAFYSDLESREGSIDRFVEKQLGFGENTLSTSFSPEQVDGVAMAISRFKRGRGVIIGHDTGIGKGRMIAASIVWALKQRKNVVFITDGAHLFSDIARDLRDIGEWGRVRPFVMNADGQIADNIGDDGVLVESTKVGEMRRILADNTSLKKLDVNVVFTTYSQISGAESGKAQWLKGQLDNALLIADESHIAAGSDSNIATQVAELTQIAWNVMYSSATWLKTFENLHIYARAFPESVNVATLADTMRRGGPAFSEVFSTMLAREGAFVRCEHDLSKLEFVMEVDEGNRARNTMVADQVSEIMGLMAFTSGDLKRLVMRASDVNIAALREARDSRLNGQRTSVFKSKFGTGSMLYQVHRRVNAALNADNAIRLAIEGIKAGRKPVIVFEDTGEAIVKQALLRQATVGPDGKLVMPTVVAPPTVKDLMLRMLDTLRMVRVEDVGIEDLPFLADEDQAAELDAEQDEEDALAADGAFPAGEGGPDNGIDVQAELAEVTLARRARLEAAGEGAVAGDADDADEELGEAVQRKKRRVVKWKLVPFWEVAELATSGAENFKAGIEEIERKIAAMADVPLNAPDEIARRLRQENLRVGELSGRSFELRPLDSPQSEAQQAGTSDAASNRDNNWNAKALCQVVQRKKGKVVVNATVRAFNAGELDVLQINRSAATGISLHASPRFADTRRRQLIEMQIPENPTDRVQLYGRVNRFDQISFPLIQVASTGNYGEQRQIMVQNKKLVDMSANVRSSRENRALITEVPDLLNPIGREVCRTLLVENPEILSRLDLDPAVVEEKHRDFASLLTSRIPLLRSVEQGPTYEQVYAMFDDAVMQAELAGENPLRPNELDVRATVSARQLLFGFDHQGLGSAFDGAVFAERLDWKEDVRPLPLESILSIVEANRTKLLESGQAEKVGETANGQPVVELTPITKVAVKMANAQMRASIMQPEMRKYRSVEEAFAAASAAMAQAGTAGAPAARIEPTLKNMLKLRDRNRWLDENLPSLVPGTVIETVIEGRSHEDRRWRRAVILDIVPPAAEKDYAKLVRWRVFSIAPGEARAQSVSLHALMGEIKNDGQDIYSKRLSIGRDFVELSEKCIAAPDPRALDRIPGSYYWEGFQKPFVGMRDRKALVLTGNMYLASEWATQTKAGKGVVFTDDRGLPQRGILLESKFKPEWLQYLPVRLWTRPMLKRFVERLMSGEVDSEKLGGAFKVHTSFDSAWKATEETKRSEVGTLRVAPGLGLVMNVGLTGRSRINGLLRQAQKKIKEEVFKGEKVRPADDPGHVVLKERDTKANRARRGRGDVDDGPADMGLTRKQAELVVLQADTPEKMQRALEMMMRGPGLEIYAPGASKLGQVARECVTEFFIQQLRKDAEDEPARTARLEERLAEVAAEGADPMNAGDADDLRALFESLREETPEADRDRQEDFGFVGGSRRVEAADGAEEPAAAPAQHVGRGAAAEMDVVALFARPQPAPHVQEGEAVARTQMPAPRPRVNRPRVAA